MGLKIKNGRIVGTIDNLEDKLDGKIPITREELLVLVDSWGRSTGFYTKDSKNKDIYIESCKATQSEQTRFVRCNPIPFVEWISAKERS